MPSKKIAQLKHVAAGALMSVSAYVEAQLDADEPAPCPSLAALSRVIAIHKTVATTEAITPEQLQELEKLILLLAQAAHREAGAL